MAQLRNTTVTGNLVTSVNTTTGNLIVTNGFYMNDGVRNRQVMYCYDDYDAYDYGSDLIVQPASTLYLAGGEAGSALRTNLNAMYVAAGNVSALSTGEYYVPSAEEIYIAADGNVSIYSNCQTITNRLGIKYDTSGYLRPLVNATRQLGSSSYYWGSLYVGSIIGSTASLSSTLNVSGAATLSSTLSVGSTLTVSGETTLKSTVSVSGTITPSANQTYSIGNSTLWFSEGYFNQLYLKDKNVTKGTAVAPRYRAIYGYDSSGYRTYKIEHRFGQSTNSTAGYDTNTKLAIGLYRGTVNENYIETTGYSEIELGSAANNAWQLYRVGNSSGNLFGMYLNSQTPGLYPSSNNTLSLGTDSMQWKYVYSPCFIGTASSSNVARYVYSVSNNTSANYPILGSNATSSGYHNILMCSSINVNPCTATIHTQYLNAGTSIITPRITTISNYVLISDYTPNAIGVNAICIGNNAYASATNSIAIGDSAFANRANAVAIGKNAIANVANSIVLGDANAPVYIPNIASSGAFTRVSVYGNGKLYTSYYNTFIRYQALSLSNATGNRTSSFNFSTYKLLEFRVFYANASGNFGAIQLLPFQTFSDLFQYNSSNSIQQVYTVTGPGFYAGFIYVNSNTIYVNYNSSSTYTRIGMYVLT